MSSFVMWCDGATLAADHQKCSILDNMRNEFINVMNFIIMGFWNKWEEYEYELLALELLQNTHRLCLLKFGGYLSSLYLEPWFIIKTVF